MKLYEIIGEIASVRDEIEEYALNNSGEISEELINKLNDLKIEKNSKIDSICYLIKQTRADSEAIKNEFDTLAQRKRVCDNIEKRLKEYLANYLNGDTHKSSTNTVSYRKSTQVVIEEGARVPWSYARVTIEWDKLELKKALENSIIVPGASIVEKQNIQIR